MYILGGVANLLSISGDSVLMRFFLSHTTCRLDEYGRHIDEAATHWDVGRVYRLELVQLVDGDAAQQIGIDPMLASDRKNPRLISGGDRLCRVIGYDHAFRSTRPRYTVLGPPKPG